MRAEKWGRKGDVGQVGWGKESEFLARIYTGVLLLTQQKSKHKLIEYKLVVAYILFLAHA